MKRIQLLVAVAVLAVVLAGAGFLALRGGDNGGPAVHTSTTTSAKSAAQAARTPQPGTKVPAHVLTTLAKIDAGDWPPKDGSGTKGGGEWRNRDGTLPRESSGKPIKYKEWDVNLKQPGRNRDAERIVTGSDNSAWYTADHYSTFARIR